MKTTINNLREAFIIKLRAMYDVEIELTKALPKMAKKATDEGLKTAFEEHLAETENHVRRLEDSFRILQIKPAKLKVEAIRGLVADNEWIVSQKPAPEVLDSMLIGAAGHVEHYEIAGYQCAISWARLLGYIEVADLLEETLQEEETAVEKLMGLAAEGIDERAMSTESDEGEEEEDDDEKEKTEEKD